MHFDRFYGYAFAALSLLLLLIGTSFAQQREPGGDFVVVEEIPANLNQNEFIDPMSVSVDGRYVAYDVTNNNRSKRIVLYDRATGKITKLSKQIPPAHDVQYPLISANGHYVVFTAFQSSFREGPVSGYLFDTKTGTYRNILAGANGQVLQSAGGGTLITDMSSNGRYIVYTSSATNPFDGKNVDCHYYDGTIYPCNQAFLYDRLTGKTERISVNNQGKLANRDTYGVAISDDGRYAVFESGASNLDGGGILCGEDYYCFQLYLRDRKAGTTRLLTKKPGGTPSDGIMVPLFMNLSKDGKYASYVSGLSLAGRQVSSLRTVSPWGNLFRIPSVTTYPDVIPKATDTAVVFLQNIATGENEVISISNQGRLPENGGLNPGDISLDDRYVLFISSDIAALTDDPTACDFNTPPFCAPGVFLRDRQTKTTTLITPNFYYNLVSFYASNIVGDANQILLPGINANFEAVIQIWARANATLPQPACLKSQRVSDTQVNLTWADNTGGVAAYHVERSLDGRTDWQEIGVTSIGTSSFSDMTAAGDVQYHYRVFAADTNAGTVSINSFYDDPELLNCKLPPIQLESPGKGAKVNTLTPTFVWKHLAIAREYRLVVIDKHGNKPVDQVLKSEDIAQICTDDLCSYNLGTHGLSLADMSYTWKVKAKVISDFKTKDSTRLLEVDYPGAPNLFSPSDHAENTTLSPIFTWAPVVDATSFTLVIKLNGVEVFSNDYLAQPCIDYDGCAVDTYGLIELQKLTTYQWRVIARNAVGKSKSPKWTFTTGTSPGEPSLKSARPIQPPSELSGRTNP